MGITVEVRGDQKFQDIRRAIERLADQSLQQELLESIGAVVESQTRRRISSEKSSPAGEKWQDWSDSYAKTRHSNQSLLQGNGDLLDSIQYVVTALSFVWVRRLIMAGRTTRGFPARCLCQPISDSSHRHLDGRLNTGYGKPWGRINVC
ncbi:phage virion morphogenesis protein [Citrobacter freundii]|uniref:phage virion morphogenesis protein n=1 Tax=Citrobacter freundii TaxID=546 RepID=UPI001F0557FD|nr:phage virion morphogenesis protein [Citrobacter freundii]UMB67054.1 phage virion morphogenesis protein [Citrobacter freundii]